MQYKTLRGELLVQVDKEDKYSHKIAGTDITLFIEKDFGWNEREKNAVNATVLQKGKTNLGEGDRVVCWHNTFIEQNLVETVETDEPSVYGGKKKLYVHAIRAEKVFFSITKDGIKPMPGFLIVNRIYYKPESSSIIITEINEQKEDNRVIVVAVPDDIDYVKPGDILIVETMADYEVVYADEGKEQRLIRIKEEDIIAIDHDFTITDKMRIGV